MPLALAVGTSCGTNTALPESGAVLLNVTLPATGPQPDELRAWIYDKNGVLFKSARVPAQGALPVARGTNMGTVLIQPGAAVGDLRIHLRAFVAQQRRLDGIVVVTSQMRSQSMIQVAMQAAIPADDDDDDVPDVIDDCLPGFNPDQGGCPPPTDHVDGGADSAGVDGSSAGGMTGGTRVDAGTGGARGAGGAVGMGGATGSGGASGMGGATGSGGASGMGGATGSGGAAGATGSGGRMMGGSPGCGVAFTGSGAVSLAEVEGGNTVTRQYGLSLPSNYNPQRLNKVVMVLGAPASSVDAIRQQVGVQGSGASGANDEIFVYPFARVRNFGSWGTLAAWQLGPGAAQTPAAGLDDVAFIDDVLADLNARFCIDTQRIFVIGFGWGADFANALACERGNVLRAIAGASNNGDVALSNPAVSCVGQAATWTLQGKGDTHLGIPKGTVMLNYWLNRHGCSNNTQPLAVAGPNGNEDCVSYLGCNTATRWCAYDASYGSAAPSYLGREALSFFRGL
jgi:predicted esterase